MQFESEDVKMEANVSVKFRAEYRTERTSLVSRYTSKVFEHGESTGFTKPLGTFCPKKSLD
jgi:hypothetical protein